MKTKKRYEIKSYIEFTFYALAILFIIWVIASWINVVTHNTTDCNYWVFNFFRLFDGR